MPVTAALLTEVFEILTVALFASAIAKSLFDTISVVVNERYVGASGGDPKITTDPPESLNDIQNKIDALSTSVTKLMRENEELKTSLALRENRARSTFDSDS